MSGLPMGVAGQKGGKANVLEEGEQGVPLLYLQPGHMIV